MGEGNLKDLMEALTKTMGRKKVRIGKVNPLYAKQLREAEERHEAAHEVMKAKLTAYHEQLKKEHEPECRQFQELHSELWEVIMDELGVPEAERSEQYSIDPVTGAIEKSISVSSDDPFDDSNGPIQ